MKKNRILYISILLLSVLFYLAWYWLDGIILTEDAQSYITMQSDREPGYCVFLAVLRWIFGERRYLHAAVLLQCFLAALAASALTLGLRKRFALNWFGTAMVLLMQYGVTLLNRFVAQRHCSYYNCIETEGLSYSFWVFFVLSVLGVLYDRKKKDVAAALAWSVVLISIRKQMLITLIILFFCLLYIGLKKDRASKRFAVCKCLGAAAVIVLLGFGAAELVDCCYNFVARGEFVRHSGDSSFILGTELYLADETMAEKIQSDVCRELFLEIMRRTDEQEYNIAYAGEGWQKIEDHYSMSYDRIKFDIMMPVIREYCMETGASEDNWLEWYNDIAGSMVEDLLFPCIPGLIKLFCCNFIHGLITSVLKVHRLLNPIAFLIYAAYIALFVAVARLHKLTQAPPVSSLPFAAVVLLMIVINDAFTSTTIYPQMRYMLYNTALFYQAGVVMLSEITGFWTERRKKVKGEAYGRTDESASHSWRYKSGRVRKFHNEPVSSDGQRENPV